VRRSSRSEVGGYLADSAAAGSTVDWVATAPTPASAQLTSEPTPKKCDWTATPSSPLDRSRATIE
jgi:hypothetical protein